MNLNFQNSTHFQNILRIYTFWIYFELFGIFKILWEYHEIFKIFFSIFSMLLREVTFPARRACIPVFHLLIHSHSFQLDSHYCHRRCCWLIHPSLMREKGNFWFKDGLLHWWMNTAKGNHSFSCPPATFQSHHLCLSAAIRHLPSFLQLLTPNPISHSLNWTFSIFTQKSWKEQLI